MRIIDRMWTDLSLAHQSIPQLQQQLENEFGRAVTVAHQRSYRRELTDWQKKRRTFFALVALAVLTLIALCLSTIFFSKVWFVLAWWAVTVFLAFILLAVAGWSYIRQVMSGKPLPRKASVTNDLQDRWWQSLAPQLLAIQVKNDRGEVDFLSHLASLLPDDWLGVRDIFVSRKSATSTDLLVFGPTGLWIFEVVHCKGTVEKKDGVWMLKQKKKLLPLGEHSPDDEWLRQRDEILTLLQSRLPHLAWAGSLVHGGVVFSDPKVVLRKEDIQGNSAPYGPASAWMKRLLDGGIDERFNLQVQLEILDALITATKNNDPALSYRSARDEARRLYDEAAGELRLSVSKMVG